MRIGFGYDVHRFVENRSLILGAVEISYNKGLAGHSDADVLLHAICDALLGAAAARPVFLSRRAAATSAAPSVRARWDRGPGRSSAPYRRPSALESQVPHDQSAKKTESSGADRAPGSLRKGRSDLNLGHLPSRVKQTGPR